MSNYKDIILTALTNADIEVGGNRTQDIQIYNEQVYERIVKEGSLGLGESYMDKWWDANKLDDFLYAVLKAKLERKFGTLTYLKIFLAFALTNKQNLKKAKNNISHHYDIGNDLYSLMLDKRMVYSCGYWKNASSLDEAQEAKLDLICKKLELKKGMTVLDIGCGWGGFAKFAASKYGVHVTGVTLSAQQASLAKKRCEGLSVTILEDDYRNIDTRFDRVLSIGMFEHVGPKNYAQYFQKVYSLLKDDGLSLLHTIGTKGSRNGTDPFIEKYIFPGGVIPAKSSIEKSVGNFVVLDWHNFGRDYDTTLLTWHNNFEKNWNKLSDKYSEKFRRMWNFYLLSCAATFRVENILLWQIVMSKQERPYTKVR